MPPKIDESKKSKPKTVKVQPCVGGCPTCGGKGGARGGAVTAGCKCCGTKKTPAGGCPTCA